MLHYILATLAVYIVLLLLLPQQVAAVTLLAAAWLTSVVGKIDWTTIPWQP